MPYRPVPVSHAKPQKKNNKRIVLLTVAGLAGMFVLANIVVGLAYAGKTYPGWKVAGKSFGSVSHRQIESELDRVALLPEQMTLGYEQKRLPTALSELGVAIDADKQSAAIRQRHWLPFVNLVAPRDVPLVLREDGAKLQSTLAAIQTAHRETPVDARIAHAADGFNLVKGKDGSELDVPASRIVVVDSVAHGKREVALVVKDVRPAVTDESLAAPLKKLQSAVTTPLTLTYGAKKYSATPADVAGWYRPAAGVSGGFAVSDPLLRGYLSTTAKQAGIRLTNMDAAVQSVKQSRDTAKPLTLALQGTAPAPAKVLRYCTAVRGVGAERLPELQKKAYETFADDRGWGLGGLIDYQYATSGCDFTIWLSSAAQMSSFGAICDSEWSCMVAPNVVINVDRWDGASPAWNQAGGYLADYRDMVINHETGHWLGFGHTVCPGAGQQAPVMQQQSIVLGGCTFNAWPSTGELAVLKGRFGL